MPLAKQAKIHLSNSEEIEFDKLTKQREQIQKKESALKKKICKERHPLKQRDVVKFYDWTGDERIALVTDTSFQHHGEFGYHFNATIYIRKKGSTKLYLDRSHFRDHDIVNCTVVKTLTPKEYREIMTLPYRARHLRI